MRALLTLAIALIALGAQAQPAQTPRSDEVRIAPGSPATVGRNGAVSGLVPNQTTKVPEGTKSLSSTERSVTRKP